MRQATRGTRYANRAVAHGVFGRGAVRKVFSPSSVQAWTAICPSSPNASAWSLIRRDRFRREGAQYSINSIS